MIPPRASANAPRTLSGTAIDTYYTTSGTTLVARDLSTTTIAAWVPDGSGGYTSYPGTGKADGTFTIPMLPTGACYVQFGTNYYWTSASTLDLGTDVGGRVDATAPSTETHTIFNVTGMTPWQDGDDLQWFSANSAAYDELELDFAVQPTVGSTVLSNEDAYWVANLSDTTKGDVPYVTHLPFHTVGAESYCAVSESFTVPSLVQTDGSTTTVKSDVLT